MLIGLDMANCKNISPNNSRGIALTELRKSIFNNKSRYRSHLAKAPVAEKLRVLEEMRDFTLALQAVRNENKSRVRTAWNSADKP
jgi:hypothetical protein